MYDSHTLDEALRVAPRLSNEDALGLRHEVARYGLDARHAGVNVLEISKEIVRLAAIGLDSIAPDELMYLDILRQQVIEDGVSPADILLRNWHGAWACSVTKLLEYLRIA